MMQSLPFVERYAWFTLSTSTSPTGLYTGSTANQSGAAYRAPATVTHGRKHMRKVLLITWPPR